MVHLLESPIQFLMLFMTRQLIESFVYQTNLYCKQVDGGNKPNGWTEVTYEEILAVIYWSCHCNGLSKVTKCFRLLVNKWHFPTTLVSINIVPRSFPSDKQIFPLSQ